MTLTTDNSSEKQTYFTVLLFAGLQQCVGKDKLTLPLTPKLACLDVFKQIQTQYDCKLQQTHCKVAQNHSFCAWHTQIQAGDEIAFIPPVSGG